MEIIILPIAIGVILAPPFMSTILAHSLNLSYWKWFTIGCVLPLAANIILFFLPEVQTVKKETDNSNSSIKRLR